MYVFSPLYTYVSSLPQYPLPFAILFHSLIPPLSHKLKSSPSCKQIQRTANSSFRSVYSTQCRRASFKTSMPDRNHPTVLSSDKSQSQRPSTRRHTCWNLAYESDGRRVRVTIGNSNFESTYLDSTTTTSQRPHSSSNTCIRNPTSSSRRRCKLTFDIIRGREVPTVSFVSRRGVYVHVIRCCCCLTVIVRR